MKPSELIGKRIARVYSRHVYSKEYDCTAQDIFLQLDGGSIVSIPNDEEDPQIIADTSDLAIYEENVSCESQTIVDVLASGCLPYYVLLLSNGKIIFGESPTPKMFNWYIDDYSERFRERYDCASIQKR